jgi:hypothetical protein
LGLRSSRARVGLRQARFRNHLKNGLIPFPNSSKNPNKYRRFKEQLGNRFGYRVPTHHNIASPYIKSSLDDLLELHTKSLIPLKPLPPPTRLEATRAPPSGQGALPEPPEAAQPLALDGRWPEQAIVDRFEVEKKDTAASPSSPPDLVKLTVRIPDATTPF